MKDKNNSLTSSQYAIPFVLITLLFFLWGFARAILDVLNKHFQNVLDISITQSALIQVTTYLGYFIMAIPSGMVINKFGYRVGVVTGLFLFGAGSLLFVPCSALETFYAFLAALFVIGCGLTFLETAANPYVTELGPKATATSRLNFSQSFNGLGCMFATFGVGQFLFRGQTATDSGDVAVPYAIMGIVVLAIALVFGVVKLPEISHAGDAAAPHDSASNLRALWRKPMFVFGLAALLAYEVAEISINSYFINFVTGQGWMDDRSAANVITAALFIFMTGRFAGSFIMRRVAAEKMLLACAAGTVACMALVLTDTPGLSLYALIANYLFEAIMFPTIFSLTLRGLGTLTKNASSILMMTPVGGCGFLLMGIIADKSNFIMPFVIPLAGFCVVLAYAVRLACKPQQPAADGSK